MKTVLVVDDEPKILEVVRDYLADAGFSVVTASDGQAALDQARAVAPRPRRPRPRPARASTASTWPASCGDGRRCRSSC